MNQPKDLPAQGVDAGAEAQDQADAYGGVLAPLRLHFDDGTTLKVSPHPLLRIFDNADRAEAWDDYMEEIESYDREEDIFIPEHKVRDAEGNETGQVLPSVTKKGKVMGPPYYKDGKRVKPPHEVRTVQIALGPEKYKLLCSKKIDGEPASYADVIRLWTQGGNRLGERQSRDPKSDGGAVDLASVSEADS